MSTATSQPDATPQPPEVPTGYLAYISWWLIHCTDEQFHRLLMLIYPLYALVLVVSIVLILLLADGSVARWTALAGCCTVSATVGALLSRVRKWGKQRRKEDHRTTDGLQE